MADVTTTLVTYRTSLGPGVELAVEGVPTYVRGGPPDDDFIDFSTAEHLERLFKAAGVRMAAGETDSRMRFADEL